MTNNNKLIRLFTARAFVVAVAVCYLSVPITYAAVDGNDTSSSEEPLTIEDVHWGFGNQTVYRRFSPVSILIHNNSDREVEVNLALQKVSLTKQPLDLKLNREKVYFSPNASRWVHFYPFTSDDQELWQLSWGTEANQSYMLPATRLGPPVVVVLQQSDIAQKTNTFLKRYPEEIFPTLVTATDGLAGLATDHAPRWQASQAKTCLDWLSRGGQLHLFHNADGKLPEFEGEMAVLNSPETPMRFGLGQVIRHTSDLSTIDKEFAETVLQVIPSRGNKDISQPQNRRKKEITSYAEIDTPYGFDLDSAIFGLLKKEAVNSTRWILIYLTVTVYVLAVFPTLYTISRSTKTFRNTCLYFLAIPALFSIIFYAVGYRDPHANTEGRFVALARPLHSGTVDVTQWDSVSVSSAGQYAITHQGTQQLYSMADGASFKRKTGGIHNAPQGQIDVPMYAFSSQNIIHRAIYKQKIFEVSVIDREEEGGRLQQLAIQVSNDFPEETIMAAVCYRGQLYRLGRQGDRLVSSGNHYEIEPYRADQFKNSRVRIPPAQVLSARGERAAEPEYDEYEFYRPLFDPMVEKSADALYGKVESDRMQNSDTMFLLVFAPMPKEMFATFESLGKQSGCVLYMVPLND